jgi:DNA processing protein
MATGIDRVYPAWHLALADEIVASGALVTELRSGSPPLQFHFPKRNRIISGLSMGTVVVEAAERSGSLITASLALEQGRAVFAVPGPVGTASHQGCHRLIRQGATLVGSADEVLEEIAPMLRPRLAAARADAAMAALGEVEQRVAAALGAGAATVDRMVAETGLEAAVVLETLLALELRGLVEQRPGMRFVTRRVA